jgi:hypothetical protein
VAEDQQTALADEALVELVAHAMMASEGYEALAVQEVDRALAAAAILAVREHDVRYRILREHLLAAADLLAVQTPAFAGHLRELAHG